MARNLPSDYDPELGFCVLEGFLSEADIAAVLSSCAELLALPPEMRHARDKVAHGTNHLEDLGERSVVIAELISRSVLREQVEAILGPRFEEQVISYRSPQPGHGGQRLHTDDVPKLDDGPDLVATAIVTLTDFTAQNGCTRLVPGSHRRPDLQRLAGNLETHREEIALIAPAGTAFVFSGHTLHSGTTNNDTKERPALQLTWRVV